MPVLTTTLGMQVAQLLLLAIPVAWNPAGGYQTPLRKVLDIHDNTMRACVAAYRLLDG